MKHTLARLAATASALALLACAALGAPTPEPTMTATPTSTATPIPTPEVIVLPEPRALAGLVARERDVVRYGRTLGVEKGTRVYLRIELEDGVYAAVLGDAGGRWGLLDLVPEATPTPTPTPKPTMDVPSPEREARPSVMGASRRSDLVPQIEQRR